MKNHSHLVSGIVLLASFLLLHCFSQAQVLWVDAANTTGIEDGTELHPFNTIREGIDAASQGYLVKIRQGVYHPDESWSGNPKTLFLKAGVRLEGEGCTVTVIDGIIVDQQASNLPVGLEKLSFDEFHFARSTVAGPFTGKNTIINCCTGLISLPFGAGIPVNDTTPGPNHSFDILDNGLGTNGIIECKQGAGKSDLNFRRNVCGYIYLKSGGGYTYVVDSNTVEYGIFDKSAANKATISHNRIINGLISDLSGGNQYGAEDEFIENNIITADENSPAFADEDYKAGIIAKSRSATIRNNTVTCTGHVSGIRSSAGAPLHITGNTITVDEVQTPNPDPYEGIIGIFNYSGWGTVTGNKVHGGDHGYYSKAGTVGFSNNEIEKSFTGFYSMGAEVVHHNVVKDCKGDGMILDGLRGPLHHNEVVNNGGAGIRVTRVPIDLGGGDDASPGQNTLKGNGNYDLYIETVNATHPTLFARYNLWDHETASDIASLDIRDGSDSTGLVNVDFTPVGGIGATGIDHPPVLSATPNPFRESTLIVIDPHRPGSGIKNENWILHILDQSGRELRIIPVNFGPGGKGRVTFLSGDLAPGVYFCMLEAGNFRETLKLVLL